MPDTPGSWYHTIELAGGEVTPGFFDTREAPTFVPWPPEVTGGRCLDVGTFDGFWAFELEARGAREVVAADIDDPAKIDWAYDHRRSGPSAIEAFGAERGTGFAAAAARRGSAARWVARSVYELDRATDGEFDVVICGALLLHLRDPIRALESMRSVCSGVLILVEALDPLLEITMPRVPCARLRAESDQWWRVNSLGLLTMVTTAGFAVREVGQRFVVPPGPGCTHPRRLSRLAGIAARQPHRRGMLTRAVIATPRLPFDAGDGGLHSTERAD